MANVNITKQALVSALKDLLEDNSFEKISVAAICERCGMNRKSFYYHFKDKYELVTWVYDTEFLSVVVKEGANGWDFVEKLCIYFDENRSFYRKMFCVEGQNSFSNYLSELLSVIIEGDLDELLTPGQKEYMTFYVAFYVDAFLCSIRKWILEGDDVAPREFCMLLKHCFVELPIRSEG